MSPSDNATRSVRVSGAVPPPDPEFALGYRVEILDKRQFWEGVTEDEFSEAVSEIWSVTDGSKSSHAQDTRRLFNLPPLDTYGFQENRV